MNMIEKKMTTKEVAESLSCTAKTVLENAKKCLPNKVFENGKPTEWNEAEVTVLLDYMKEHSNVGAGIDLVNDLQAVSTSMTPALKRLWNLLKKLIRKSWLVSKQKRMQLLKKSTEYIK